MAETIGIVASAIAVAQIAGATGKTLLKLKQLWDEVGNVSESIDDLMMQINCLEPTLWDIEQTFQNDLPVGFGESLAAKSCAKHCRRALDELSTLTEVLARKIHSSRAATRKITCLKVLLKKDQLRTLQERLKAAVWMLQLAQQGYMTMMFARQPKIIADMVVARMENSWTLPGHSPLKIIPDSSSPATKSEEEDEFIGQPDSPNASAVNRRKVAIGSRQVPSATNYRPFASRRCFAFQAGSQTLTAEFLPPRWLSGVMLAWNLQLLKSSYAGWKLTLRGYSIQPYEGPAFQAASKGDAETLHRLFDTGKASPYDRDQFGRSLLNCSTLHSEPATLELFIRLEIEVDRDDIDPMTGRQRSIAHKLSVNGGWSDHGKLLRFIDLLEIHGYMPDIDFEGGNAATTEDDRDSDDDQSDGYSDEDNVFSDSLSWHDLSKCSCPRIGEWAAYSRLQPYVCPGHQQTSLASRLFKARRIANGTIETLKFLLEPDWSDNPEKVCSPTAGQFSLVHTIADKIVGMGLQPPTVNLDEGDIYNWNEFARQVVLMSDVHLIERDVLYQTGDLCTPLTRLVLMSPVYTGRRPSIAKLERHLGIALRRWLRILKRAGINLCRYGRHENGLLRRGREGGSLGTEGAALRRSAYATVSPSSRKRSTISHPYSRHYLHLIKFKYGPEPEDWDVYWGGSTDKLVGDFWRLVEDPPLSIPGDWPEPDADSDSDLDW